MSETGTRAGQDTDRRDSLMLLCLPAGPQRARQHEHSAMPDTVNPGPSGHGRESSFPGPPSPGTPVCSCSSLIRPLMPRGPLPSPAEAKERTDNPVFRVAAASHEASLHRGSRCRLATLLLDPGQQSWSKLLPQDMAESFALFFDSKLKERLPDLSPSHRRLLSGS